MAQSKTSQMALLTMTSPVHGFLIVNFAVGRSAIKKNLIDALNWKKVVNLMSKPNVQWKIRGFSDCSGSDKLNEDIRHARADAIYNILPEVARKQVVSYKAAQLHECIAPNLIRPDRTMNRSVLIEQAGRTVDFDPEKEKPIEGDPPKFVCGPDVTRQVADAVMLVKSIFKGFNHSQKKDACDALISFKVGDCSWDIVKLHNNKWIHEDFRFPGQAGPCATAGAKPACGETVQIDDECHHSGAVNYVIFGTMFKLCREEDSNDFFDFSKSNMKALIDLYKGSGKSGLATPVQNFKGSMAWAQAGYDEWPGSGSPSGDWNHCVPMCPLKYTGQAFDVHWHPHHSREKCP